MGKNGLARTTLTSYYIGISGMKPLVFFGNLRLKNGEITMMDLTDSTVFLPLSALAVWVVMYLGPKLYRFLANDKLKVSFRCFVIAGLLAFIASPVTVSSSIWLEHAIEQSELIPKMQAGACLGVSIVMAVAAIGTLIGGLEKASNGN